MTTPEMIGSIAELHDRLGQARDRAALTGGDTRIVLVPTMGALHAGHLELVRRAHTLGDIVVVSIFVNPLQFGAGEDLDSYPRTLKADLAALEAENVAFVFAPSAREMYPGGTNDTRVTAGTVGSLYEGAARPGHFDGMLTVVAKLLGIVTPDAAVFGQKDGQQAFLVQRMVADLNVRTTIEVVDTVREPSGLALSSRNRYLDDVQHTAAQALFAGLNAAVAEAQAGPGAALTAARARIAAQPLVKLDYLVIVHPETFLSVPYDYRGPARMLVAARVGTTRLIDNVSIRLG
ncbi:pantoate--beta-alanine ligase [Cryobacterium sp. TMT1-3]|uniref:Pantothenate synthetase n=1 Tax=Cryobacterium luteum TaxID=1424661 RepID=A0A1H8BQC4_9MICO|nr:MULTISPECIES: pantoate--beta-alanine ligase [Cryobacterium]TFB89097.1 pantoate--beta-alanine ligase [Cryobacterium luteum]TFC29566.1 pantoate--beta-alanine ligase [Cryobacterium sp. TMT1-3]SEM85003.1 pantothenate synthetase [Cryobacterium luteum]